MNRFRALCSAVLVLAAANTVSFAQSVTSDPSLGVTVRLQDNQTNQLEIWVHNWSTTVKINGKYYSADGSNHSSSKILMIIGGNLRDEVMVRGSSTTARVFAQLHGGHDDFNCTLNRPMVISGGSGNDVIFGSNSRDKLYGDAGKDELRGGKGLTIFLAARGMTGCLAMKIGTC